LPNLSYNLRSCVNKSSILYFNKVPTFVIITDNTPATFETPEHGEPPRRPNTADVQISEKNIENVLNGEYILCNFDLNVFIRHSLFLKSGCSLNRYTICTLVTTSNNKFNKCSQ